jgi:Aspartyl protease/PDZ domain
MKRYSNISISSVLMLFLLFSVSSLLAQSGFRLPNHEKRDRISFQLLNNLVVIPVSVNGKELSFILDTGARHSLLFSLSEIDSLEIKNVTPIKIRGLGEGGTIDALKSSDNYIQIGNAVDRNSTLYVIFDESINFSPRMGIPIHGVLGYEFFKDFVVKIDYSRETIIFYDPLQYEEKQCKKCETFDLFFNDNKPYISPMVTHGGRSENVTLLLDSGSSDALWLFDEKRVIDEVSVNYFEDFLGYGISGGIYGKRSKLENFAIGNFTFNKVTVAFPNPEATEEIVMFSERAGSLGAGILKRFTVIMDYRSHKISLKKNRFYNDPFHYNMAGIVVEHDGAVTVNSFIDDESTFSLAPNEKTASDAIEIKVNPILNFFLAPRYVISEVRKGSPADLAEIRKGDEVVTINGKPAFKYKLYEITELFSSKENRKIQMEIKRNGKVVRRKFVLKEVL